MQEFGFIIRQKISRRMTKAKLAEKLYQFLNQRKRELMQALQLSGNEVCTRSSYYQNERMFEGVLRARKECTDAEIKAIHRQNKVLWEEGNSDQYSIEVYTC